MDVYGLQILDATLAGNTEEEDTAASALLLKHEFLDGGADDVTLATLGEVLLEPTTLGNFLVRSNSQSSVASASFAVGGFQLEGYAMTLSAFAWNIVRTYTLTPGRRYSFGCRYRLTDLGNEFATLDRELPENAVRRTKRPEDRNAIAVVDRGIQTLKKDLATRVARKGGQWSDHFERAAGAYNARPHETVHGAPEDVEKQPATEFRVLQDNADKFQHNKDLSERRVKAVEDAGAFRAPTNAARSFNPQYGEVQRLGAVDSMTVRSTEGRETLLKLALPAPGSGNAAGRLTRRRPAAVRQLDDFLAPPRPRTLN